MPSFSYLVRKTANLEEGQEHRGWQVKSIKPHPLPKFLSFLRRFIGDYTITFVKDGTEVLVSNNQDGAGVVFCQIKGVVGLRRCPEELKVFADKTSKMVV